MTDHPKGSAPAGDAAKGAGVLRDAVQGNSSTGNADAIKSAGLPVIPPPPPPPVKWTEFPNLAGAQKIEHVHQWPEFTEYLRNTGPSPSKGAAPLLKMATFGDKRTASSSLRHDDNMLEIYGIEGDYDGGEVSMAEARMRLELSGIRAAIYPTANHTDAKPRWRVICLCSKPHPVSERSALVARLNGALGGILASESFTASQAYYFGKVAGTHYEVLLTDGRCIDELPGLDRGAVWPVKASAEGTHKTPVEKTIFAEAVKAKGRLLCEGDGRRELLKTFVASRSNRGLPYDDLLLILRGVVAEYFDPDDPVDWDNVDALAKHFCRKDTARRSSVGFSAFIDPETGEILAAPPAPSGGEVDPEHHQPVDPFAEHPVPEFPLEVLPEAFSAYARECSQGSGFDAGAYGFSLLVLSSGMIDHRARLRAGPMRLPPHLWGSLSADSGGGKSPILAAASFSIHEFNKQMLRESTQNYAAWARLPNEEKIATKAPPIRQLLLDNTTTEAAGKALHDNPEGVLMVLPELSEWVGRMDAYSGGHGGDKDRGAWIRAFDGGPVSINRARDPVPMVLDNFSAAMLAGIQPEKLAQMFAKSAAGGADGLFQRFLHYCLAQPGEVNYAAQVSPFSESNVTRVFAKLAEWRAIGTVKRCDLSPEAKQEAEAHHNLLRVLARRTPPGRFAEHIDKLPGLTLRVAFVLHVLHAAAEGMPAPSPTVTPQTFRMAQTVMRVLYRHAEAAYAHIDHTGVSAVIKLAKAACEAILTKDWLTLQRGDLTRYATGWSGADERHAEAAVDLLIDWAWLADVTPETSAPRRGRRSMGRYAVNPVVRVRFEPHAQRIVRERAERHQAIQRLATARREAE